MARHWRGGALGVHLALMEDGPVELLRTQVDLAGLMRVLGNNLYSSPEVALRELVQNAHDSCVRRRLESEDAFEPRIVVSADPDKRTLSIVDNGAGLCREEIVAYLATLGAGYTGKMRAEGRKEEGEGRKAGEGSGDPQLIGAFGLGFASAFFVSDKVELFTTSYKEPTRGHHFASRGGERYQLGPAPPGAVGTRVLLHLGEGFAKLAEPTFVARLLERYCGLLRFPIHPQSPEAPPVNRPLPPWHEDERSPLRRRRKNLDFARKFEARFEPICTFELSPRDATGARGLLWIQDGSTYGTSDNRNLSVFVRGMLVSSDARELLPSWAGFAGGVIESDALVPTASREDLQRDKVYQAISAELRESLIDGLAELAEREPSAWRRVLLRHNEALLGAALCDGRLFGLLAEELKVPTSEGDLTLPVIRKRSEGKIHVSLGEEGSYEEILFRALRVPVVTGTRYAALPFCKAYAERVGATVVQLGTRQGDRALFPHADLPAPARARLDALFGAPKQQIVPARFSPSSLPLVLVVDREVALKQTLEQDKADRRVSSALLGMARLYTKSIDDAIEARLYVNLESKVIRALLQDRGQEANERAAHAARLLKAVAVLLSGRDEGIPADIGAELERLSAAAFALVGGEE